MNKARRKKLDQIQSEIEGITTRLEGVIDEEQEARDCIPENLEYSEPAYQMEEFIDTMQTQRDALEEAQSELEAIANG